MALHTSRLFTIFPGYFDWIVSNCHGMSLFVVVTFVFWTFTQGVIPALAQGPLSRFGDTAANTGVLTALNAMEATRDMNVGFKTVAASVAAGLFRIFLMPIDTVKTTMQVTGKFSSVVDKIKVNGPLTLYNGSIAAASATVSLCFFGKNDVNALPLLSYGTYHVAELSFFFSTVCWTLSVSYMIYVWQSCLLYFCG
jgi:hypothetical protein